MLVSLRTFTEARKKISSLSTGYGSERLQRAIVTLVLRSSWVIICMSTILQAAAMSCTPRVADTCDT